MESGKKSKLALNQMELAVEAQVVGALKAMREGARCTQIELGTVLEMKQAQVSAIENGRRTTSLETVIRWAMHFGGTVRVDGPGAGGPRARLLALLSGCDDAAVEQLARASDALLQMEPARREEEVKVLELRAKR